MVIRRLLILTGGAACRRTILTRVTDRLRRLREGAPGLVAAARRRVRPRLPTAQTVAEIESHFVVCGDDALALRLVEELIRVHRPPVTGILPSRQPNPGPQIARIPGA